MISEHPAPHFLAFVGVDLDESWDAETSRCATEIRRDASSGWTWTPHFPQKKFTGFPYYMMFQPTAA